MKQIRDPFPPTPEGFHLRVERTLRELEERDMNYKRVYRKAALLAVAAALILVTAAVAVVAGNSGFRDRLASEGLSEVTGLVQEPHISAAPDAEEGFAFSVDEIIWEDDDLYVSYSLSVPEDGSYLVALYTPTLNGERLEYDAKGFTLPKFIDQGGGQAAVLLLGGARDRACSELLTLKADPDARNRENNRLAFRAALLKTDYDFEGSADWTDLMNPPECVQFWKQWREWAAPSEASDPAEYAEMMDAVAAAFGDDGLLTVDELVSTGYAECVTERTIDMGLDGTKLAPETLFNDVAERDFDRMGVHVHIDRFRMTHLGVEVEYTVSMPGAKTGDDTAIRTLNDFAQQNWRFGTVDGKPLGYSLGGSGGGGWSPLEDGTPACRLSWREDAILPLEDLAQIAFAPTEWVDDESGNHPVYDLENAIALTPVYSEAIAETEAGATPTPAPRYDEDESGLCY